jgi:release factor glutamine methyltransferase
VTSNLKELYEIQEVLKGCGYHDFSRISKEILKYCEKEDIPPTLVLERIKNHEPWEYIKGECDFHGLKLQVNQNTLIPRVETEQLVDIAHTILEKEDSYEYVLDVGTGSGCIIIFLAKILCKKKNIKFLAVDTNPKSLEVAKKNSMLHKVNEKVSFLKSNLLKKVKISGPSLIIANLPYVPSDMYKKLNKSVVDFEPRNAIDGGKDGLKYYRKLLKQIQKKNTRKYKVTLLMEIEPSTLKALKKLLGEHRIPNSDIKIFKDFREKERFILVHLS